FGQINPVVEKSIKKDKSYEKRYMEKTRKTFNFNAKRNEICQGYKEFNFSNSGTSQNKYNLSDRSKRTTKRNNEIIRDEDIIEEYKNRLREIEKANSTLKKENYYLNGRVNYLKKENDSLKSNSINSQKNLGNRSKYNNIKARLMNTEIMLREKEDELCRLVKDIKHTSLRELEILNESLKVELIKTVEEYENKESLLYNINLLLNRLTACEQDKKSQLTKLLNSVCDVQCENEILKLNIEIIMAESEEYVKFLCNGTKSSNQISKENIDNKIE
ncbi:MAG: hypothetical protein MHPSP_001465, partial [Paramarteilia canceri]